MFSITGLHRLVFDLKVNGFIWSMTIHLSVFLRGVFLVIVFCINTSHGQDICNSYTLIKVPDASPLNQTAIIGNASESYCQSSCFNQNNCYGYTWLSGICYLNINPSINYTAPNATYYSLIRSLPNCNQRQTCSYYWYGIKDTHGFGAVQQNNINNLNDCVKSCQQTASCASLDWDTTGASGCWILSPDAPTGPAPGVYHFPKDCRNVTTVSTTTTTTTTTPVIPGTNMESEVTPLHTTTTLLEIRTTGTETGSTQSNSQGSDSSKFDHSAKSSHVAVGVGVGVGVGVPVIVVIIVLVIRAVRLKTVLAQKNRNDRTELGPVQEPSAVGQVRDSANNQYQQLNWNLDNSSGTTYDKLQLQTPSTIAA